MSISSNSDAIDSINKLPIQKIYLRGAEEPLKDGDMRFRLAYSGQLFATQPDDERKTSEIKRDAKRNLRKAFHQQLKDLWRSNEFLKNEKHGIVSDYPDLKTVNGYDDFLENANILIPLEKYLASQYQRGPYAFVPTVIPGRFLQCSLNILFMRKDNDLRILAPSSAGDIDNRVKTLLDALQIPKTASDYPGDAPDTDEKPFYCLLADDRDIVNLSVETDQLLGVAKTTKGPNNNDKSLVNLIITVDIRPYHFDVALNRMYF